MINKTVQSLGIVVILFSAGFTAGQLFFDNGLRLVGNDKYVAKNKLDDCIDDCNKENDKIRENIFDSLKTRIEIFDTPTGRDRISTLERILNEFPYIETEVYTDINKIERILESPPKIFVAHFHAYGHSPEDEKKFINVLNRIDSANFNIRFLIYSQTFNGSNNMAEQKFFSLLPDKIKSRISLFHLSYRPTEDEKINAISRILYEVKRRMPK